MANLPIRRELFEQARKSSGTDEDILFIHRKVKPSAVPSTYKL